MGQFACECTATGSGRDQFDYTDLYVAQFTLPDGSVVYLGGEYDSYGDSGRAGALELRVVVR